MRRAIPSLVTSSAILCALVAIAWASEHPYWACNAIIAASLLDMVDGRIARVLNAQTAIGGQLDSLADVIAFGATPAMLAYVWMSPLVPLVLELDLAILPCFGFAACAALRLARFNLAADGGSTATFTGIPTPVAALTVTTWIMTHHELELEVLARPGLLAGVMLALAGLMVAPIPFPSFKHFRKRWTQVLYFGSMMGGVTMLVLGLPGGTVLFALLAFYILRGLILAALGSASDR